MENESKNKSYTIWIFLVPVFLLAAWPALQWMKKANSGDLDLSKDDSSVFNSQEGEIRKAARPAAGAPEFNDGVLSVRYKTQNRQITTDNAAGETGKEQYSTGYTKGYLTLAVGKALNDPVSVAEIFNNKSVISGFMDRTSVRAATATARSLAAYLKTSAAPADFINNRAVRDAMNNPAIVNAIASSGLIKALIKTPGVAKLLRDPDAVNNILRSTPQLKTLSSNPNIIDALMKNPDTAPLMRKVNTGLVKPRKKRA